MSPYQPSQGWTPGIRPDVQFQFEQIRLKGNMIGKAILHILWLIRILLSPYAKKWESFCYKYSREENDIMTGFWKQEAHHDERNSWRQIPIAYNHKKIDHILIWKFSDHSPSTDVIVADYLSSLNTQLPFLCPNIQKFME